LLERPEGKGVGTTANKFATSIFNKTVLDLLEAVLQLRGDPDLSATIDCALVLNECDASGPCGENRHTFGLSIVRTVEH